MGRSLSLCLPSVKCKVIIQCRFSFSLNPKGMESAFPSMFESYDPTTLPKGFSKTLTDESGHLYYEYDQPILKPAQDVRDYVSPG